MSSRIILFGLGIKAYHILLHYFKNTIDPDILIVIGRDSGIENDYSKEIVKLCNKYNVKHIYRENFRWLDFECSYAIAVGWRWIITAPEEKLVIIHDSLLPKYRGFSPLVNCLINGERTIGATAIFGSTDYDRGDIITQKSIVIDYPIKIKDAIDKMTAIYIEIFNVIMDSIKSKGHLIGKPQIESEATYSLWRSSSDYFINWQKSAEEISRFVDAVGAPYDGAKATFNGETIRLESVSPIPDVKIEDRDSHIGKIIFLLDGKPVIVCKIGLLTIHQATTLEGDSIIPVKKFRSRFN